MIALTGHIRKYQISFWTKHGNSKNFWNIVIWKLYQSLGGPLSVQTWEAIWSNMHYFFVLVVLCLKLRGSNTQHMCTCTELQQPKQTTHFRSQEENFPPISKVFNDYEWHRFSCIAAGLLDELMLFSPELCEWSPSPNLLMQLQLEVTASCCTMVLLLQTEHCRWAFPIMID